MGRLYKQGLDLVMGIADLACFPELAEAMVAPEIELRRRFTASLTYAKEAAVALELTRTARSIRAYAIDRIVQRRLIAFKGLKNQTPSPGEPK